MWKELDASGGQLVQKQSRVPSAGFGAGSGHGCGRSSHGAGADGVTGSGKGFPDAKADNYNVCIKRATEKSICSA